MPLSVCLAVCMCAVEANEPEGTPVTMREPRCLEVSVAHSRFGVSPFYRGSPEKRTERWSERGFSERFRKREGLLILCGIASSRLGPRRASVSTRKSSLFFIAPKRTSRVLTRLDYVTNSESRHVGINYCRKSRRMRFRPFMLRCAHGSRCFGTLDAA